jgi:hypothetical protein
MPSSREVVVFVGREPVGSGFIVGPDRVLTAKHLFDKNAGLRISVMRPGQEPRSAHIVWRADLHATEDRNRDIDIAVLGVKEKKKYSVGLADVDARLSATMGDICWHGKGFRISKDKVMAALEGAEPSKIDFQTTSIEGIRIDAMEGVRKLVVNAPISHDDSWRGISGTGVLNQDNEVFAVVRKEHIGRPGYLDISPLAHLKDDEGFWRSCKLKPKSAEPTFGVPESYALILGDDDRVLLDLHEKTQRRLSEATDVQRTRVKLNLLLASSGITARQSPFRCAAAVLLFDRKTCRQDWLFRMARLLHWRSQFGMPFVVVTRGPLSSSDARYASMIAEFGKLLSADHLDCEQVARQVCRCVDMLFKAHKSNVHMNPVAHWADNVTLTLGRLPDGIVRNLLDQLAIGSSPPLDRESLNERLSIELLLAPIETILRFFTSAVDSLRSAACAAHVRELKRHVETLWVDIDAACVALRASRESIQRRYCGMVVPDARWTSHIPRRAVAGEGSYTFINLPSVAGESSTKELMKCAEDTLRSELNLLPRSKPHEVREVVERLHTAVFATLDASRLDPACVAKYKTIVARVPGVTLITATNRSKSALSGFTLKAVASGANSHPIVGSFVRKIAAVAQMETPNAD